MTADTLKAAHADGVQLTVDGDDLVLEASAEPPPVLLDVIISYLDAPGGAGKTYAIVDRIEKIVSEAGRLSCVSRRRC